MHNPESVLANEMRKLLWEFEMQMDHRISARQPDTVIINFQRKRNCRIVDFSVPADHRWKLKESEKKDNYLDLAKGRKNMWYMKLTVIPTVIDFLGRVTKGLVQRLEDLQIRGWVGIIQSTALLRSARMLRRVLETWWYLLLLLMIIIIIIIINNIHVVISLTFSLSLSLSLSLSIYLSIYLSLTHSLSLYQSIYLSPYSSLSSITSGRFLDDTLCPYRVGVDKFLLVVQHLHVCEERSLGERRLWVRSYLSSIVKHVLFVLFGWF